ncbi:hypothetical protein [Staphylococcus epidermidis]|nr:hypothetical protein [Staphylococcus epidermidis]
MGDGPGGGGCGDGGIISVGLCSNDGDKGSGGGLSCDFFSFERTVG